MRGPALNVIEGDRVLVVSADSELRLRYIDCLCIAGLKPRGAASGAEALRLMALHRFDGVIADTDLRDMPCAALLDEVRADPAHADAATAIAGRMAPVVVIAALTDRLAERAAGRLAATIAALSAGTSAAARNTT